MHPHRDMSCLICVSWSRGIRYEKQDLARQTWRLNEPAGRAGLLIYEFTGNSVVKKICTKACTATPGF